jgi:hypothetical protein
MPKYVVVQIARLEGTMLRLGLAEPVQDDDHDEEDQE